MVARSRLFGRDAELAQLIDLTGRERVVTVTGAGGVGKTRLVEEATELLRASRSALVLVAHLADVDRHADCSVLSAEVGMSSPEALAVSLGDGGGVVVLDNCEHVLGAAVDLVERLLAATDVVSVLATSREPLRVPGEHVVVLQPLSVPTAGDIDLQDSPAVAMFLDRATASGGQWPRTDDAVAAVAELCRRVDGLPLAIELAAARARSFSPPELLSLLDRRLDVLRAREQSRPSRHRSVRAAIEISTQLLDDQTRTCFHRLAVFTGAFDLDLAHAVAGPDPTDRLTTVDLIAELVERSLLVPEHDETRTRYRLLELVREYVDDALQDEDEWHAAHEQLTAVMVDEADRIVAEGVSGWSAALVARIAANVGNLTTAVDWCIDHDPSPARAFRLYVPLFAAVHQSRSSDVRALGQRLFERWPVEQAPFRGEALAVAATAYAIGSMPEQSTALATAALEDAQVTAIGRVVARRALMLTAIGCSDVAAAREHALRARIEADGAGLAPFERELAGFEASLLDRAGLHEEAAALAAETTTASIAAGDTITEIWARLVSATVAMRSRRLDEARDAIERAMATSRSIDDAWWTGAIFRSRALLASYEASTVAVGDGWERSKELWRGAIEGAARRGDLAELALTLRLAAVVAARVGRVDIALLLLDAVPPSNELTVLPELFEDERARLDALRPDAGSRRPSLVASLRAALAAIDEPATAGTEPVELEAPAPLTPRASAVLRREGDVWALSHAGTTVRLRDAKGLRDIARLVSQPGREVHCLELMGGAQVEGSTTPLLDDKARRQYQERVLELQHDIETARSDNDPGRAERAEVELDLLVQQLSEAYGLGGRARGGGTSAERARTAVTYRIRAAIKRIEEAQPELGRHLAHSVRTGAWCVYHPEIELEWHVDT